MDVSNIETGIIVENDQRKLSSGNLVSFLSGVGEGGEIILGLGKDEFPSELKLPWAKDYIDEIYAKQRKGKHLPENVVGELQKRAAEFRRTSDNKIIQKVTDVLDQQADEEGLLEASRDIYHSISKEAIYATEIRYGSGFSVKNTIFETYGLGFPLLAVHTHPESQLPSVDDYVNLMMAFDDNRRVLSGIVVLCPEGQILALATKDTPRFGHWEEAINLTEEIKMEQGQEKVRETDEYELWKKGILGVFADTCIAESRLVAEAKEKGDQNVTLEAQKRIEETTTNVQVEIGSINKLEMDKLAKVINQQGVANANRLGICLYWSNDGESFIKFSA